jgi:hypothetical protein
MKNYIYGLFAGEEQIDQTSLDEENEELAYEIMVKDEGRTDVKNLTIELVDVNEEVQ